MPRERGQALAVLVTFRVQAAHRAEFRDAVCENARISLETEVGCQLFDVCEDPETKDFVLYEIYRDAAAFDHHLSSSHFHAFDRMVADWVEAKTVHRYTRLAPAKS
ncbi:putative quinol monooxygenase [Paraburkholderia phenoliruptrix]|uniref:putative quinol monooxygenase n=1 Tax=Paraburkholderia phenoliruptrix TaxID=252970 RepID=UPI002869D780|nr:putative quinol monooxygenase [Paraburkholderia phenoliruptrix]WMY11785.1 putative quinol monooxygenase [Paraburkholderia phenoliruptrix]